MHTGTPFVSVGFTAISVLLQTLEQQLFFSHYLVSAEKPQAIYLPHCLSVCVYIQTSMLHIFHTIYCCVSAAKPQTIFNYITLYQCMLFFHTISKMSCKKQLQSWKVTSIVYFPSVSRSQQQCHCSC